MRDKGDGGDDGIAVRRVLGILSEALTSLSSLPVDSRSMVQDATLGKETPHSPSSMPLAFKGNSVLKVTS